MPYNDFIILRKTKCYFVDYNNFIIRMGIIVGYDNINDTVHIKSKNYKYGYDILYRNRKHIWFDLEECLLWLNEYLRNESGMGEFKVMELTSQLNGIDTEYKINEPIGDRYTIYLNGLRQDRNDFEINDQTLIIKVLFEYIPTSNDTLSIEYWKPNEIIQ